VDRPPTGHLARLLELEQRLEAVRAAAQDEARRLMDEAKAEAAQRREAFERELAEAAAGEGIRLRSERDRAAAAIEQEAKSRLERLEQVTPERLHELAGRLLDRLIEEGAPAAVPGVGG
jgi:hypothetical protein